MYAAGEAAKRAAVYNSGAKLYAGNIKVPGIRPIAVGEVIRRLVSKFFSFALANKTAEIFAPLQLGFGVHGGCEAIVHTVRSILEDSSIHPDQSWLLQVDLINAFNCYDREAAFIEVRKLFPEASRWVEYMYGSRTDLVFGDTIIKSCQGGHQGDPLVGLIFAAVLNPTVKMISVEAPNLLINAWFADDGNQVGHRDELIKVIQILLREGLLISVRDTIPSHKTPKSTTFCP